MVNASQSFESPVFESRIEMAPISLIAFLLFCCFFWGGGGKGDVDENDRVCHEFVEQGCPSAIGMDRHVK